VIAGVDGYRDGWVAAIDLGNGSTEVRPCTAFSHLLAWKDLSLIVIDVPIGLLPRGARQHPAPRFP